MVSLEKTMTPFFANGAFMTCKELAEQGTQSPILTFRTVRIRYSNRVTASFMHLS